MLLKKENMFVILVSVNLIHRTYAKYLDRRAWANTVDPHQMTQNTASDQGLYCWTLI